MVWAGVRRTLRRQLGGAAKLSSGAIVRDCKESVPRLQRVWFDRDLDPVARLDRGFAFSRCRIAIGGSGLGLFGIAELSGCATSFTTIRPCRDAASLSGWRWKSRRRLCRCRAAKAGVPAMMKIIDDKRSARPPFAPPFLKAGKLIIAQTANILFYLGPRLNLSPRDEEGRLWAHQLQLTITDLVVEIHAPTIRSRAGSIMRSRSRRRSGAATTSGAIACRNSWVISSACCRRMAANI